MAEKRAFSISMIFEKMLPAEFSLPGSLRAHRLDALRDVRTHILLRRLRVARGLRPSWTRFLGTPIFVRFTVEL